MGSGAAPAMTQAEHAPARADLASSFAYRPEPGWRVLVGIHYGLGRLLLLGRVLLRRPVAAPVWWLARALSGQGSQAKRHRSQAQAVVQALEAVLGPQAAPRGRVSVVSSGSALVVANVRQAAGQHMVVKLADSAKAADELRLDASVRARLASDGRLKGWCDLLPEVVAARLEGLPAISIERHRGCCDGRIVLAGPLPAAAIALRSALDALGTLHQYTHERATVEEGLLRQWVREPLALIGGIYPTRSWQSRCVARLEFWLCETMSGREVVTGWSHGDYTPANLLFGPGPGRLLEGVVDWGAGSPNGLLGRDSALLTLTTVMLRHRLDLGGVMVSLLEHPSWLPDWDGSGSGSERWGSIERLALEWRGGAAAPEPGAAAAMAIGPTSGNAVVDTLPPSGKLGPVTTLWLAWAQHISRNIAKADKYSRSPGWRVANVDVVLTLVGRGPGD